MNTTTNTGFDRSTLESLERVTADFAERIAKAEEELAEMKRIQRLNLVDLQKERTAERLYTATKARFDRAVKAARKAGVHMRTNIVECCRGCVTEEKLGLKDATKPYGWTYGGQGNYLRWDSNGEPQKQRNSWTGREEAPERVFYNWGNGAAEAIVEAFRAEGFEVEWDGQDHSCVEVIL